MGRKNIIKHYDIFDAETINTNVTSEKTNVEPVDNGTINIDWSGGGSPSGTITIEASNSTDIEFTQGTEKWIELDFGLPINVTGNSGNHQIIFDIFPFRYMRMKYNSSSGTATMSAKFHATTVGA